MKKSDVALAEEDDAVFLVRHQLDVGHHTTSGRIAA
jgi:hypothetical protein